MEKLKSKLKAQARRIAAAAVRARAGLRWAALAPAVALTSSPVWAALPTLTMPTSGIDGSSCSEGDLLCLVGAYFKQGIGVFAIVVAALFLIFFGMGSFTKWKGYSNGRTDAADLKEYVIYGGLVTVVVLALCYLATKWAGITS